MINIADDEPCSQLEVIQYCYDLLGLKIQSQFYSRMQKMNYHPSLNRFGWKIEGSNKLLCETLGYKLIYKNYKQGLKTAF